MHAGQDFRNPAFVDIADDPALPLPLDKNFRELAADDNHPRLVESVIALSIIYVAVENCLMTRLTRRWIVTFGFGLVHGFGFYGILRDLQLPHQGLVVSLCAFNLGVEIGQMMIVTLCYPLLVLLAGQPWRLRVVNTLSLVIGGLGLYWFVERAFFA